jgi:hypothetical protein
MRSCTRCLALAVLSVLTAPFATAGPRAIAERAATLIENNYFDATRAGKIAEEIKTASNAGRFDSLKDPRDLAATLTARLAKFDHHFKITWSGETAQSHQAPSMSTEAMERRNGYGFRRVEMLPGAIGLIDMRMFADFSFSKPGEPARRAADAALALICDADAIILDLRNNGGGSPAMVGYLVSAFTAADAKIYNEFHRRDGSYPERPAEAFAKPMLDKPLLVLISGRTASAGEAFAYTLQAARRATIVGETSAGAANPGGMFPIADGFNIFISTGTPINAVTGTNWESVGVKPDVAVRADHALVRAQILALEAALAQGKNQSQNGESQWILEALRVEESAPRGGSPLTDYSGTYQGARISIEGEALALHRGKRPPVVLAWLKGDTFFARDEPYRRVLFERDRAGKVSGLQLVRYAGESLWFRRSPVSD